MNILFIGNSYTYFNNMPLVFELIAHGNQKEVCVKSITQGGARLERYADAADPLTVTLEALLADQKFDVCFIQEQSLLPAADFERFTDGLGCVVNKLKGHTDHLILYATWGRKIGSEDLSEHNWTPQSMTKLLSDAYQRAAERFGTAVSQVGINFWRITQEYPEINLYNKDLSHPSYQGSCLAALTHYYTLFGEFPSNTAMLSLRDAELAAFKAVICR